MTNAETEFAWATPDEILNVLQQIDCSLAFSEGEMLYCEWRGKIKFCASLSYPTKGTTTYNECRLATGLLPQGETLSAHMAAVRKSMQISPAKFFLRREAEPGIAEYMINHLLLYRMSRENFMQRVLYHLKSIEGGIGPEDYEPATFPELATMKGLDDVLKREFITSVTAMSPNTVVYEVMRPNLPEGVRPVYLEILSDAHSEARVMRLRASLHIDALDLSTPSVFQDEEASLGADIDPAGAAANHLNSVLYDPYRGLKFIIDDDGRFCMFSDFPLWGDFNHGQIIDHARHFIFNSENVFDALAVRTERQGPHKPQ